MTRPQAAPKPEFEQLRSLLLGAESARLDELARRVEGLDGYVGQSARLEVATAEIIAKSLRRAEVERHRELANAIAPLVVSAIQSEIRNSRDMMVEALYPITGRLVAASVAAAFRDLNARIEKLTSLEGLKLRLRGLVSGKAAADLALALSLPARIMRILFLERGSGILVANWQLDGQSAEQAELVSGLIAAITEFAASALAGHGGELRTLDLGASRVILRASSRMIIAADCEGTLSPSQETALNAAFLHLLEQHDTSGATHEALLAEVAGAVIARDAPADAKKPSGKGLHVLAAAALGLLAWWGTARFFTARYDGNLQTAFRSAIAADAGLAAYPLTLVVEKDRKLVTIHGLTPDLERIDAIAAGLRDLAFPRAVVLNVARVATFASMQAQDSKSRALGQQAQQANGQIRASRQQNGDAIARLHDTLGQLTAQIDTALAEIHAKQVLADGAIGDARTALVQSDGAGRIANAAVLARLAGQEVAQTRLARELEGVGSTAAQLQLALEGVAPQVEHVRATIARDTGEIASQINSVIEERDRRAAAVQQQVAGLQSAAESLRNRLDGVASAIPQVEARTIAETQARLAAERQHTETARQMMDAGQTRIDGVAGNVAGQADKLGSVEQRLQIGERQAAELRERLAGAEKSVAILLERMVTPEALLKALLMRSVILFEHDDVLDNEALATQIAGEIALLVAQTGAHIRVVGHTDETGSLATNARISEKRAGVVMQMLVAKGMDAGRILAVSRGNTELIASARVDARALSRRVTFELVSEAEAK